MKLYTLIYINTKYEIIKNYKINNWFKLFMIMYIYCAYVVFT